MISVLLLAAFFFLAYRMAPRERQEDTNVHGAGQIGLLAAVALFGVDYFTSYFYATGELLGALHPYGMQQYAYIAVAFIALANFVFGALYMYSLGVFKEGGGSFTAAMRYLGPSLSLIVAVVLIQDYIFTIVVSSLSGVDQLLSLRNATGIPWIWHVLIGIAIVSATWYLTIRGRGESAQVVFIMIALFGMMTLTMFFSLFFSHAAGQPAASATGATPPVSLPESLYHMLTASMKGLVALTGLEAMSDGIQFVIDEDAGIVQWGKRNLPKLKTLWNFYSGKTGIGRFVQTSFLFYGGLTTLFLTVFAIRFNVFDGTNGRSLVANLAFLGFGAIPNGEILFWVYQLLAVVLLAAASMTAYQDLQAMAWRNVAIGEIPEIVVYRNPKGTFTRPVTAAAAVAVLILFLVQGRVTLAVPYYGVGVFLPITAMGLAIRTHILKNFSGRRRKWGSLAAGASSALSALVFLGQIVGKWEEGGWVVLISLGILVLIAHAILLSPVGFRHPEQIHRIIREKSRVQGAMGNIAEWQSLRAQEYRYNLLVLISRFAEVFGIRRPLRFEPPVAAGEYEESVHGDVGGKASFLEQYLQSRPTPEPKLGGKPKETDAPDDEH
jgi:hypothetical protein